MEQIEEFIVFKGAFELGRLLENTNDAPYEHEVYEILKFCFDNYKEANGYILECFNRYFPQMEKTNALQEPMEEEIVETGSSLDEKEEESDEQKEEEWIYPCLPSNESNSLSLTLFDCPPCLPKEDECHVPEDSFENVYNKALVFVDHEKHALCDSYIVEFIHEATENYYERGKYGCRSFHGTKTLLYVMKVLKLLLFYLPMPVTLFFVNLFSYKIPMNRKWVRLKFVLDLLLDALFYFNSYFL